MRDVDAGRVVVTKVVVVSVSVTVVVTGGAAKEKKYDRLKWAVVVNA